MLVCKHTHLKYLTRLLSAACYLVSIVAKKQLRQKKMAFNKHKIKQQKDSLTHRQSKQLLHTHTHTHTMHMHTHTHTPLHEFPLKRAQVGHKCSPCLGSST